MKNFSLFKSLLFLVFLVSSCDKNQESTDTVKDIDGNIYKTVVIGSQVWMKENLRTTRYRDGSSIPNVINYNDWIDRTEEGFCWYRNDTAYKEMGALYNYYAVIDPRNVCPEGWHVSTDNDWKTLELYLGLPLEDLDKIGMRGTTQGDMLKSTNGWFNAGNGNNITGFSAFPSFGRWYISDFEIETDSNGFYTTSDGSAAFWSPTNYPSENYHYKSIERFLIYNYGGIGRGGGAFEWAGAMVRCIKDK